MALYDRIEKLQGENVSIRQELTALSIRAGSVVTEKSVPEMQRKPQIKRQRSSSTPEEELKKLAVAMSIPDSGTLDVSDRRARATKLSTEEAVELLSRAILSNTNCQSLFLNITGNK